MNNVNVLILAGQRCKDGVPLPDALCLAAGVKWKALLPIHGKPMIDYVVAALDGSVGLNQPYFVSGLDVKLLGGDYTQSPSADGPASSVVKAAQAGLSYPFLVTTCDHALLSSDMVNTFIKGAQDSGADFALGLASKSVIAPAYPETKRTYLKFKDEHVSGCNLFYVKNENGLEAVKFWRAAQHDRKRPLKLARRLGIGMLIKYLSGCLTLKNAFETTSNSLSINAKPILLPFAEAAIDVDKPSDLTLVEDILAKRQG